MVIMDEIKVTCETIISSDIEAIIDSCNAVCHEYCQEFAKAYVKAKDAQEIEKSHVFHFLSLVCSLSLHSSDANSPFQPCAVIGATKTVTSSDFTPAQCKILSDLCSRIVNPELAARVADLAWATTAQNFNARIAIKKYIESMKVLYYTFRYERPTNLISSKNFTRAWRRSRTKKEKKGNAPFRPQKSTPYGISRGQGAR